MCSDHPPFLGQSAWWAELKARALRQPGPGREPASQPALPVSGAGLRPGTNVGIDCLAEESWAARGNLLPSVPDSALGSFLLRDGFHLWKTLAFLRLSPGLAWSHPTPPPPGREKRDAAAAEKSEALGRVDGGPSESSEEEGLKPGGKSG